MTDPSYYNRPMILLICGKRAGFFHNKCSCCFIFINVSNESLENVCSVMLEFLSKTPVTFIFCFKVCGYT